MCDKTTYECNYSKQMINSSNYSNHAISQNNDLVTNNKVPDSKPEK